MNREELIRTIRESKIAYLLDRIEPHIRPSIRLRTKLVSSDELPLGASRFGGDPDLPSSISWPVVGDKSLMFLAQIDLAEASAYDESRVLPATGWLYFFYDVEELIWGSDYADKDHWKVSYYDGPIESLRRVRGVIVPENQGNRLCKLTFECEYTLPDSGALLYDGVMMKETQEWSDYYDYHYDFSRGEEVRHRMLGNPDVVQDDMRINCQLVSNSNFLSKLKYVISGHVESLERGFNDWIYLLQIDTDEEGPGWMWGDCGRLYFLIRKQDLAKQNFAKCWMILQCS